MNAARGRRLGNGTADAGDVLAPLEDVMTTMPSYSSETRTKIDRVLATLQCVLAVGELRKTTDNADMVDALALAVSALEDVAVDLYESAAE